MLYDFGRLPSALCWGSALLARAPKVDLVDSTESIFNGGIGAMAVTPVLAGAAGVLQVLGKAVRPTVEKWYAVAHMFCWLTCLLCSGSDGLDVRCMGGILRSMESSGLCGHFGEPSLLVLVEMQLEIGPGVICFVLVVPGFNGVREDASFAECKESELDGGAVRDGLQDPNGSISHALHPTIFGSILPSPVVLQARSNVGGHSPTPDLLSSRLYSDLPATIHLLPLVASSFRQRESYAR